MLNVLVVDDDTAMLDLLKSALTEFENCAVTTADSPEEALHVIAHQRAVFDCILIDIDMPMMSGAELLAHVRGMPGYTDTPAIMMTTFQERDQMDEALVNGAFDHITKPVDFFELRSRMNAVSQLIQKQAKLCRRSETVRSHQHDRPETQGGLFGRVLNELYGDTAYQKQS